MNTPTTHFGPIRQIAYVVEDIGSTVQQWLRGTGIGPWFVFRNVELDARFHGRAGTVRMDVALGYQGELEIELIRPTSFVGSPYVGAEGRLLLGPHHIAFFVEDVAARARSARDQGLEPVFFARNPVVQLAYLEFGGAHDVRYELIQYTPDGLSGWHERVRAARDWDGTQPLREFDLASLT